MIIILFIVILAVLGIKTQEVHNNMRTILKEEGYKIGFYIRYFDIKQFLNDNNPIEKKEKLRKLAKTWIYLAISAGIIFVATIIIVMVFPSILLINN